MAQAPKRKKRRVKQQQTDGAAEPTSGATTLAELVAAVRASDGGTVKATLRSALTPAGGQWPSNGLASFLLECVRALHADVRRENGERAAQSLSRADASHDVCVTLGNVELPVAVFVEQLLFVSFKKRHHLETISRSWRKVVRTPRCWSVEAALCPAP